MALTVRPDDEVYQFDTVWLGPDEYTLPIQARYVAWGTWLACFLVAVVVLVPFGGGGPGGVLGSIVWSLAVSVVLSRAVMLVVDHERPLRSLPALFSAEARTALAARRRGERSLLIRPAKVRVRGTPEKVLAMRARERERLAHRQARRHPEPAWRPDPVRDAVPEHAAPRPDWRSGPARPEWTPDLPPEDWSEPAPAWSVPGVPTAAVLLPAPPLQAPVHARARHAAAEAADRQEQADRRERQDREPVMVAPNGGRHAAHDRDTDRDTERDRNRDLRRADPHDARDRQAAVEARILLPVRKDR